MAVHRAGGHVDRGDGKGWVVDTDPAPATPEPQPHKPFKPAVQVAGGWMLSPPTELEPASKPALEPVEEPSISDRPSDSEIRAWAKEAGVDVPTRGRLSQDVVDLYLNREK